MAALNDGSPINPVAPARRARKPGPRRRPTPGPRARSGRPSTIPPVVNICDDLCRNLKPKPHGADIVVERTCRDWARMARLAKDSPSTVAFIESAAFLLDASVDGANRSRPASC